MSRESEAVYNYDPQILLSRTTVAMIVQFGYLHECLLLHVRGSDIIEVLQLLKR